MLGLSLAIREFLAEGISDPDLPFKIANPIPIADHGQKEHLTLQTNSGQTIEAFSRWPHRDISNFLRDQWCFLAPQFKQGMLHMIIDDSVVLPYVEYTSDGSKEGGFSSVWGVRIHASHQDHYEATQDGTAPRIALKRLHSANYDRFERETHMLKQLAPRNHPHLIKLLGTYYHQHSYHLMFPYAPENLRGYWQRIGNPWEKTKIIEWSFRQLRGIASGLETIHDFSIGGTYETESDTLSVPSSNPRSQWGRHGDIKPENILWFENDQKAHGSNHDLGLLVLGDFGLMEFHGARTRSNVDPESIGGTPTYEPPEKRLRLPISRAFDMWSMGCMMLEFITWLLESSEGVDRFSDFRAYMVYDELSIDPFYEIQFQKDGQMYSSAVVNPRVLEWIDRLSKHDRSTQMIRDLLILVRDRLLVVDSRERMTSQELVRELDKMLEWANDDTEYMSRIQGASISRKSALRYDSSTEDLRQGGGGKRVKILLEPTDSDNLDELLIIP
ncbi:kinase-like protein [Acephala macrosclerotiorum]|nr:kinase-like protein [Acephala macrosclerotiorum]